jgi:hypothetical protein
MVRDCTNVTWKDGVFSEEPMVYDTSNEVCLPEYCESDEVVGLNRLWGVVQTTSSIRRGCLTPLNLA